MKLKKINYFKPETAVEKINLLPGPVHIQNDVIHQFGRVPISHRSEDFIRDLDDVKAMFRGITRCKNIELCLGSGTLANDLVAAQLYLFQKKGLVLSNGEFGTRLIDHAHRFDLDYESISLPWGETFDYEALKKKMRSGKFHWVWFVHHETSAGMLNDLHAIQEMAQKNNMLLCVDCISSICAVPLDLSEVDFASGTSGKAIGAYPGLSFVFYKELFSSLTRKIPRYLDLNLYKQSKGVPFTSSSNLLSALKNALSHYLDDALRTKKIQEQTQWIRNNLSNIGLSILVNGRLASPIITTILLPQQVNSIQLGNRLKAMGYHIHYKSGYLKKENWIQISSMSIYPREKLYPLFEVIKKALKSGL